MVTTDCAALASGGSRFWSKWVPSERKESRSEILYYFSERPLEERHSLPWWAPPLEMEPALEVVIPGIFIEQKERKMLSPSSSLVKFEGESRRAA